MKIKLLDKDTKIPEKAKLPDCGLDIFIPETFSIDVLETKTIGLKLAIAIPEGHAGILIPRSSVAEKGLIIQTSIIDPDYIGEIHLIITNCSNKKQTILKNTRLCSIVAFSILNPYIEITDTLSSSFRHKDGLGSSGL